jgi:RimJ/RimL family protein N-acetyltransferase
VIVSNEAVARFVSERCGIALCPPYTTLGIERDGRIVAGVIFHCFEGPSVHITVAGEGWTPGFIRKVGAYVFEQLGCLRMTITTEQDSVAKLACKAGGQVEGCLRDQFGEGRDGWVVGILRDEWRYSPGFPGAPSASQNGRSR